MRVELTAEVFHTDGFEWVIALMRQFTESRHTWVVGLDDLDLIERYFCEHAPKRARDYGKLAQNSIVDQSAWTARRRRTKAQLVTVTRESLREHVEELGRPAKVVVENREGDGAFVLAVARVFQVEVIIRASENGWLEFVQAGGSGEVPKVARYERSGFKRLTRVAFLFDSDRMTPDSVSKQQPAADDQRADGIPGHILRFREAENYVPYLVLEQISQHRAEKLKNLVPRQRAYFDIKKGFVDKQGKFCIPASQRDLYRDLPHETKQALTGGFGKELTQALAREAKAGRIKVAHFEELGPGVREELEELLALLREII